MSQNQKMNYDGNHPPYIPLFQDKLITEAGLIKTISQYTRDSRGTNTLKKALESLHSLCRRENTRIHPESM